MQTTFTTCLPNSISMHCWPLAVTTPILQLSWAIWNYLKIPWSLVTSGYTTRSFLFLEAFPIWHVPTYSSRPTSNTIFPEKLSPTPPGCQYFCYLWFFNPNTHLLTLEFLPFPLGKKCSINCFLSLSLSFFLCSPEHSTLLTVPRSVLWPCKKHSVNYELKKKKIQQLLKSNESGVKWIWFLGHRLLCGTFLYL